MNKKGSPTLFEETILWNKRIEHVVGIDEVGRGAFAGPLVVGAVVFPPFIAERLLKGINDSKLLTAAKREELAEIIKHIALFISIEAISVAVINKVGIGKANQMGFRKAIAGIQKQLPQKSTYLLVDGFHARYVRGIGMKNQKAIVKGDQKSFTIAAASIVAKVYRDHLMKGLSAEFPSYHFDKHKGYGTSFHRALLMEHGLSPLHRTAFCRSISRS